MRARTGQVAFEFTFLIMLGIITMGIMLIIIGWMSFDHSEEQRRNTVISFGRQLQDEAILAASVHEGFSRQLYLPERLGRFAYSIDTGETLFTITSGTMELSFRIPECSGAFSIGNNTITNQGGVIQIT